MNAKAIKLLRKFNRATIGSLTAEQDRQIKCNWKALTPAQRGRYTSKMHAGLNELDNIRGKLEAAMDQEVATKEADDA